MILTFVKLTGRWFADIEPWDIDRVLDLQMVDGADTLLEELTTDNRTVTIKVLLKDETPEIILSKYKEDDFGAYYHVVSDKYNLKTKNIWLCNVCKELFNKFPEIIDLNVI